MRQLKFAEFIHANTGRPVYVLPSLVFGVYFSPAHESVNVVSTSGQMFPVKGSIEEVQNKILEALGEKETQ